MILRAIAVFPSQYAVGNASPFRQSQHYGEATVRKINKFEAIPIKRPEEPILQNGNSLSIAPIAGINTAVNGDHVHNSYTPRRNCCFIPEDVLSAVSGAHTAGFKSSYARIRRQAMLTVNIEKLVKSADEDVENSVITSTIVDNIENIKSMLPTIKPPLPFLENTNENILANNQNRVKFVDTLVATQENVRNTTNSPLHSRNELKSPTTPIRRVSMHQVKSILVRRLIRKSDTNIPFNGEINGKYIDFQHNIVDESILANANALVGAWIKHVPWEVSFIVSKYRIQMIHYLSIFFLILYSLFRLKHFNLMG